MCSAPQEERNQEEKNIFFLFIKLSYSILYLNREKKKEN